MLRGQSVIQPRGMVCPSTGRCDLKSRMTAVVLCFDF